MATDSAIDERIELPTDFAEHLAALANLETPPETLGEFWAVFADHLEASDQTIEPEDLYADDPTRHEVRVDDRIRYSPCVLDALTVAVLTDEDPVTVRSVDPVTGAPVTFTVADGRVGVVPDDAVISFGVASTVPDLESDESIFAWMFRADDASVADAFCRHINAFESAETYDQWAADASAETMPVRPASADALVRRYVDLD